MKTRLGFVSNSSSSSFIMHVPNEQISKGMSTVQEKMFFELFAIDDEESNEETTCFIVDVDYNNEDFANLITEFAKEQGYTFEWSC